LLVYGLDKKKKVAEISLDDQILLFIVQREAIVEHHGHFVNAKVEIFLIILQQLCRRIRGGCRLGSVCRGVVAVGGV